ncbi:MAG: M15 family metallopeptidase [Oscillospiraceae bacterium]|nr:M15 family metallopeptidase [Oscillospiraceae bacterium]
MTKKKINVTVVLSVICIIAAILFTVIAVQITKDNEAPTLPQSSSSESISSSASESKSETQSEKPTESTSVGNSQAKNESTSSLTSVQTGSFYKNVKYRSPKAKPADIFKHGRNLMLLNNDWELPEDFKWDLVYWSNGQSVDALSLNYKKYDQVFAVDRAAYQPLKDMFAAAEKAGVPLQMVSPYRSIQKQDRLFTESVNYYMKQGYSESEAIKKANVSRTFTGTSEHNTGFGFDILEKGNWTLSESFDKTAQFKWLMENAENYGFILRYQKGKTDITGIMYEPWHFRYVGTQHAKEINSKNMCLEEYIEYLDGEI